MSFEFRPAKREAAPVLVGIAGPSGGGKTYSSLRLARGLANGEPFAMIDSENGRALHYADYFPEMQHAHLRAPFSPEAYGEAIQTADAAGFKVIVVDSMSHEWDGEGGVLEMQAAEFKRMGSKESARLTSWIAPKTAHKRLVAQLLQVKAHVILDMRAEDKIEFVDDPDKPGKKKAVAKQSLTSIEGWIPICERRLPFEMTMSLLVLPSAPGIPRPVKLQEQHRPFFPLAQPISEESGKGLGVWAAGMTLPAAPSPSAPTVEFASEPQRRLIFARAKEAGVDTATLKAILHEYTGQESSAAIPREKVDEIVLAVEAAGVTA